VSITIGSLYNCGLNPCRIGVSPAKVVDFKDFDGDGDLDALHRDDDLSIIYKLDN